MLFFGNVENKISGNVENLKAIKNKIQTKSYQKGKFNVFLLSCKAHGFH